MRDCVIVCSQKIGNLPASLLESARNGYVIAVDGGIRRARALQLEPEVWVGDGDSLEGLPRSAIKCPQIPLPKAKSYSDLEFALAVAAGTYAEGLWRGSVNILGAQGGRLDHELGNLVVAKRWVETMARAAGVANTPAVESYGPRGIWVCTVRNLEFRQPRGKKFSVLTLDPEPRAPKLTITGAKYNVRSKKMEPGTLGLSNEGRGGWVRIKVSPPKRGGASPVFVLFPSD